MNRERIRDVAVGLGVRTATFSYAKSADELLSLKHSRQNPHAAANHHLPE
ncbi:hypothetical protein [Limnohabitans sp.]|nr:hypothetical protein [Limnohabitans sp.]